MINQEQTIINQTINWIKQVVIGCNFCPFAAKALSIKNNIRFNVVFANNNVSIDELILSELKYLSEHEDIETSFTLFPDSYESCYISYVKKVLKKYEFIMMTWNPYLKETSNMPKKKV